LLILKSSFIWHWPNRSSTSTASNLTSEYDGSYVLENIDHQGNLLETTTLNATIG